MHCSKTILPVLLPALALALVTGCTKDQGPQVKDTGGSLPADSVRYSTSIQPLFNSYCAGCHNQFHAKLKLITCCSYEQLMTTGFSAPYINLAVPTASKLVQHLQGNPIMMPPSGSLPTYEIDKVVRWIQQGAKNN